MITPQDLQAWLKENAGYTYYEDSLTGFGIDGEVDLVDMAQFINEKIKEVSNA